MTTPNNKQAGERTRNPDNGKLYFDCRKDAADWKSFASYPCSIGRDERGWFVKHEGQ